MGRNSISVWMSKPATSASPALRSAAQGGAESIGVAPISTTFTRVLVWLDDLKDGIGFIRTTSAERVRSLRLAGQSESAET
jgi:hypothetical protein